MKLNKIGIQFKMQPNLDGTGREGPSRNFHEHKGWLALWGGRGPWYSEDTCVD
jgi:hypothetical protein